MDKPNPGSDEAIALGCTCAVLDNNHGAGFRWGESFPCFWQSSDCPLHGHDVREEKDGEDSDRR